MSIRSLCVGGIAFIVIVAAAACATFFIMLGNGYDHHGAGYGALIYGAMVGVPLWIAALAVAIKVSNLLAAAKFASRVEEIVETRRSGAMGRRRL